MKSVKTGAYDGFLVKILLLKKWLALIILRGTKFMLKVDFADEPFLANGFFNWLRVDHEVNFGQGNMTCYLAD